MNQEGKSTIDLSHAAEAFKRVRAETAKIVIGQQTVIDQMLMAMLARGHCLLIGVPGLAKTVMAKALSESLDMAFKRVQFTPDLMPSDITGTTVLEADEASGKRAFRFIPGPVFTNILLADEINRTPPKTQAALLEAMQERTVTFAGQRRALPDPFLVLATQNPLEQEGTYPLPEAQLDRFMFSVVVTYTSHADENRIVMATTATKKPKLDKALSAEQVRSLQQLVRQTPAPPSVVRFASALARATRPQDKSAPEFIKQYVDCGAGPRAGQYLVLAAKARAIMGGSAVPTVDDVAASAIPVLRHRIFTNFTALSENTTPESLIEQLLKTLPREGSTKPVTYSVPTTSDLPGVKLEQHTDAVQLVRGMKDITERIRLEVQQVIVGQGEVLDLVLTALLAGGHCLLVGVPGLAKTTLVQTLADVLHLDFKRVQFTPDLMPSDITGTDVMEVDPQTQKRSFRFIPGPIFSNILLADEINRTPPKTQAAMLEAMQELAVTAGGTTYHLKPPFFVLATQNPLEQEGTYPLPEAQLDRFMFMIILDYPTGEEEPVIIDRTTGFVPPKPKKVIGAEEILKLQKVVRQVPVSNHVLTYATTLVRATRPQSSSSSKAVQKYVHCGAGPRAAQYLILGAKARAVMHGRVNVSVNDVRAVAIPVLRHRIFTNFLADAEGITAESLVQELIKTLPQPKMDQEKKLEVPETPEATPEAVEAPEREPEPVPAAEQAPEPEMSASLTATSDDGMMTITCPKCGQAAEVPRASVGKKAKCWDCSTVFDITAPVG